MRLRRRLRRRDALRQRDVQRLSGARPELSGGSADVSHLGSNSALSDCIICINSLLGAVLSATPADDCVSAAWGAVTGTAQFAVEAVASKAQSVAIPLVLMEEGSLLHCENLS